MKIFHLFFYNQREEMALQLNAEQKYILKIFGDRTKYVIPPYQRAYSWTENECEELFEDLKNAYYTNKNEGCFLGNIILSTTNRDDFEVIDGQQRLTTLIMFLKVLYHFDQDNRKLKNTIWTLDDRTDAIIEQRVKTNIFMEQDAKSFNEVLNQDYQYIKQKDKKDKFKSNVSYLFEKTKKFIDEGNDIKAFIDFVLYDVSMLPIHTEGDTTANAREKALKIFETMNNRGMPLDDSDIFKSNLYYMANREGQTDNFIALWKSFDERCDELEISKIRVFKIYSYIIRGKEAIKSSEIGLRDFFEKMSYSPFKQKKYDQILKDINEIIEAIEFFEKTKQLSDYNELPIWFQLIDLYTNNFPKDLIIIYLYQTKYSNNFDENQISQFAKSLVRYCYEKGSTTQIKYYIYDLTVKVMHNKWEPYYIIDYTPHDYFGMLYKGFGVLGAYLSENQKSVHPYSLMRMRDIVSYWHNDYSDFAYIGNIIPVDLNKKDFDNENSNFSDVDNILKNRANWNQELHKKRIAELRKRYEKFFRGEDENR